MKISFDRLQLREPVKPPGKLQNGESVTWYAVRDGFSIQLDTDVGLIAITKDDQVRIVPVHLMLWADPLPPPTKPTAVPQAKPAGPAKAAAQ